VKSEGGEVSGDSALHPSPFTIISTPFLFPPKRTEFLKFLFIFA
jgi:hypothetical protein